MRVSGVWFLDHDGVHGSSSKVVVDRLGPSSVGCRGDRPVCHPIGSLSVREFRAAKAYSLPLPLSEPETASKRLPTSSKSSAKTRAPTALVAV